MAGKFGDFIRYQIASGVGTGQSPIAPGTAGSLLGLALIWLVFPGNPILQLILITTVTLVGVHCGQWLAQAQGEEDPSMVVIDEVAGQMVTFFLLPTPLSPLTLVSGFVLFRIFDIWKPWLIKRAEKLPGGWGIMMDDVVAGIFACLILHFLVWFVY